MDRLTNMEAFVRVVEAGSFSGAAKQWSCSKAVMSKYVSALEAHLGVELLRRSTRALNLTDAGRAYYARCLELLGEIESLETSLRKDHLEPKGVLRLTAPPGFVARYGQVVMTGFQARYPKVRMDVYLTHRMVDLIEQGFDVAIRVTAPRDTALIARRLGPAPLLTVASPEYLARAGTPKTPAGLVKHACLVDTNFREGARWRFERRGRIERVEVKGPFAVNSPLIIRDLAIEGHGIALVPAFLVDAALTDGTLVQVPVGRPAFDWSVFAVYPRRRYISGRVRAFIDHLAETLS